MSKPKYDTTYDVLFTNLNGSNASTVFVDETGKTITRGGEAFLDKDIYKYGGASLKLNGSTDYISLADTDDFNFGNGDFTIEYWVYFNVFHATNANGMISQRTTSGTNVAFYNYIAQADKKMYFYYSVTGTATIGGAFNTVFQTGQWYHVAIVRNGTEIAMYLDGVKESNTINVSTDTFFDSTTTMTIGCMKTAASTYSHYTNGYFDQIRISKGIARYTSNFTPTEITY